MSAFSRPPSAAPLEASLPAVLLSRYLFFLTARPVSRSNTHYVRRRVEGLRSLAPLLGADRDELLDASVRLLRTLGPGNLHEVSERLQQTLFPYTQAEVPATYISADAPPPAELLRSCERVLLILGPAIGIGDEIVTFPLPRWIKRASPGAHVTTLTCYDGLWSGVAGVDRVATYRDLRELVEALRGDADLVLLVDFENPDLFRAIASEPRAGRYAELALGPRVLSVVDARERVTYHQTLPRAYFRNVYDGFDELARRLGLAPRPEDRSAPTRDAGDGPLRLLVSAFSSKYDPSPRYWSALLARLVPDAPRRALEIRVDPGPNAITRGFARDVARAAAARIHQPGVTVAVAGDGAPLPLAGALVELARAHVVLCADSFAAHAAPRAGCTTLVLASPGLESWRVPSERSYYFDAEATIDSTVAGMREILALHGVGAAPRPPLGAPEDGLRVADAALERAVADGARFDELCGAYERFRSARQAVLERVAGWPPGAAALTGDGVHDGPARALAGTVPAELEPDARRFVHDHWLAWRNTNLRKYLELAR